MSNLHQTPLERELTNLSRALRYTLAIVVLGLSYGNIHFALSLSYFDSVFSDMLNGQPLPLLTRLLLGWKELFLAASIGLPLTAIGALFWRNKTRPIYLLGIVFLLTLGLLIFQVAAIFLPLLSIINNMSGGPQIDFR